MVFDDSSSIISKQSITFDSFGVQSESSAIFCDKESLAKPQVIYTLLFQLNLFQHFPLVFFDLVERVERRPDVGRFFILHMHFGIYFFPLLFLFNRNIVSLLSFLQRVGLQQVILLAMFFQPNISFLESMLMIRLANFCFDFPSKLPIILILLKSGSSSHRGIRRCTRLFLNLPQNITRLNLITQSKILLQGNPSVTHLRRGLLTLFLLARLPGLAGVVCYDLGKAIHHR